MTVGYWILLDMGEIFGTAINRFCCQAIIGHPLTVYGVKGGQTRGYLTIEDSMQCLTLAITNPPVEGKHGTVNGYRTFNQFEELYSVNSLATTVAEVATEIGLNAVVIGNVENPRVEDEEHFYKPDHAHLLDLGYKPNHDLRGEVKKMFFDLIPHKKRIWKFRKTIMPKIDFRGKKTDFDFIK